MIQNRRRRHFESLRKTAPAGEGFDPVKRGRPVKMNSQRRLKELRTQVVIDDGDSSDEDIELNI
jgi:hypothetical protein